MRGGKFKTVSGREMGETNILRWKGGKGDKEEGGVNQMLIGGTGMGTSPGMGGRTVTSTEERGKPKNINCSYTGVPSG